MGIWNNYLVIISGSITIVGNHVEMAGTKVTMIKNRNMILNQGKVAEFADLIVT